MPTITVSKSVALPLPHESSRFRPARDKDDVRQSYKGQAKATDQSESFRQELRALEVKIEGMRRRILGGSGAAGSSVTNIQGEYDPTATYNVADIVVISMGVSQGTFACLVSGTSGSSPTTGAPNWLQMPGGLLGQWL